MSYRLAIDTGGTFSDLVAVDDETGALHLMKVSATPDDPSRAILRGVDRLVDVGVDPAAISHFFHGTTVATNALLEERGARVGLCVTAGFRGIYEAMEQSRPFGRALFDLGYRKPPLLAPESRTAEIVERVGSSGQVVRELDESSVDAAIARFEAEGVEAVAVCLLFSFLNDTHERRVRELIEASHPEWSISMSSEVLPQIGEYRRLSTTVIDAYVAPTVRRYTARVDDELERRRVAPGRRFAMLSNGGATSLATAGTRAVATIMSGPAGGIVAGISAAADTGIRDLITFDMGGTSCDVALIQDGQAGRANGVTIKGRDIAVPMLDIATVSAGGGTLARVDAEGGLHLGPDSAGAVPGPACYGHGGIEPTVTDADVVLGYLNPAAFLAGSLRIDAGAARRAIEERIAGPLGIDARAAAAGMLRVVNVSMAEAVRALSTHRGLDVRAFTLLPFGGAGPVHASQVAVDLGISTVLVPRYPGVFSALGLLSSDVVSEHVRSRLGRIGEIRESAVTALFRATEKIAIAGLASSGFPRRAASCIWSLDLRYLGEGAELNVPVARRALRSGELSEVRACFDEAHARRHATSAPDQVVEIVNFRVVAVGHLPRQRAPRLRVATDDASVALAGHRRAIFPDRSARSMNVPVYDRGRLAPGHEIAGPAIVEQYDATTVVCPEQDLHVDELGNLRIMLRSTR